MAGAAADVHKKLANVERLRVDLEDRLLEIAQDLALGDGGGDDRARQEVGMVLLQVAEDAIVVDTRHHQIEDDNVVAVGVEPFDGLHPVDGRFDVDGLALDHLRQHVADRLIVFDDERTGMMAVPGHAGRSSKSAANPMPAGERSHSEAMGSVYLILAEGEADAAALKAVAPSAQIVFLSEGTVPPRHDALTPREREVMQMTLAGRRAKEIALALDVSVKTVSTHRSRLMRKLGVESDVDLLRYALAHRLVVR